MRLALPATRFLPCPAHARGEARLRVAALVSLVAAAALMSVPKVAPAQQGEPPAGPFTPPLDSMYALRLRDGTTVLGRVEDPGADPLVVVTAHGRLHIPRRDIAELTKIAPGSMQGGQYWPPSPNETRLLFAPTGRMLRKGDGYFSNTYLFFQHLAGGMTSRITMGGGMSLFPSDDLTRNVFYITPKVGVYNSEKTNVAVGVLAGYIPAFDEYDQNGGDSFGIVYGVSTFGKPDGHITLGGGLGYANGHLGEDPMFMIGGEKRVARRASLVTENYFFPTVSDDFNNVVSYGVRFFGERLSVDLAFINTLGQDTIFPGVPYVSFAVKF